MTASAGTRQQLLHITREEGPLAARAARGDRAAFDALFDRYYARMAHAFRALPRPEAQAKIWETLEQVFTGLDTDAASPLLARAFRIARASQTRQPVRAVHATHARRIASRPER